jgi:hypothetical protein
MTLRASWPRTEDLAFEPELAPLALLDAALAITVQALIASNPELLSHGKPPATPPRAIVAHQIVVLYRELSDALDAYRALSPPARNHVGNDDIPF